MGDALRIGVSLAADVIPRGTIRRFRVGVFVFHGADTAAVVEPLAVLSVAASLEPAIATALIGESLDAVRTAAGVAVTPAYTLFTAPALDALIIPSGAEVRSPRTNRALYNFVRTQPVECLLVSVNTGGRVDRRGRGWDRPRLADSGRLITAFGERSGADVALHLLRRAGCDRAFVDAVERRFRELQ
ncbi:MAG: hypothetical protein D6689_04415 [Deltaproteobacteria bacterium]|nr:MAG: hypothetical protein D6689_04415 [Deltaproteobacteria bacterium]